jgi:hypothetical protein
LLFIGIWTFCDDAGIHPAGYKSLKMQIFPADPVDDLQIKAWVDELKQQSLITEYEANDRFYWQVTGWRHQLIKKPHYKYPLPSGSSPVPHPSATKLEPVQKQESNGEALGPAGNINRDIDRKEKDKCLAPDNIRPELLEVFEYWQKRLDHPKAKLDKKRKAIITSALKQYSVEELKQAIDGCSKSAFHLGQNERGQKYDGIGLILRDAEQIEKFISLNQPASHPALPGNHIMGVE